MATNYLYIDDEDPSSLDSYIRAVKGGTDLIEIVPERPSSFDEQVSHLLESLTRYDGLILDWQLDDIPLEGGKRIQFRAGALAQEIRTRETSGEVRGLPIVLWSTKPKLRRSYFGDHTSHDLFDILYDKADVVDKADQVRYELIALANGYKRIRDVLKDSDAASFVQLLGLSEEDFNVLHPRFTEAFHRDHSRPAHEYARFLLKEIIHRPGVLISEEILAARLGIDKEASSDWGTLAEEVLASAKYKGPFHEAWPRWWSHLVEKKWWGAIAEDITALSLLNANERVAIVTEYTKLKNLVAAKPMVEGYGNFFQTVCEVTHEPLDPVDGVILDEKEPQPWQERRYISLNVALERRGEDEGIRPHPTEIERLKEIRDSMLENAKG